MQQTVPADGVKTAETEHFLCPNCGGNLRYDIKRQLYCCESCGSPDQIVPLHEGIPIKRLPQPGNAGCGVSGNLLCILPELRRPDYVRPV